MLLLPEPLLSTSELTSKMIWVEWSDSVSFRLLTLKWMEICSKNIPKEVISPTFKVGTGVKAEYVIGASSQLFICCNVAQSSNWSVTGRSF